MNCRIRIGRASESGQTGGRSPRAGGVQPCPTGIGPGGRRRIQHAHVLVHPSRLEGGAHVVMCDASTKFVADDIEAGAMSVLPSTATSSTNKKGIWGGAGTINGKESGKL